MSLKHLSVVAAAAAICIGLPAVAQTPTSPHHPYHRIHHARAIHESQAELSRTQTLNQQQLAQPAAAYTQAGPGGAAMQEPIARPMYQRVPGGNPLYSATPAGASAHVSGPPVQPH